MRLKFMLVIAMSSAATVAKADDLSLDLGHRLLREKGLQISGWVFPATHNASTNGPYGLDLARWEESNYTTPIFHGAPRVGDYVGPPAGETWGRTGGPRTWAGTENFRPGEYAYLGDMLMFQYDDEVPLDAPHSSIPGQTFTNELADWMADARSEWASNVMLFTNTAYYDTDETLLRAYMSSAKPDMLVFDHYMVNDNFPEKGYIGSPRHAYLRQDYMYLERVREVASEGHDRTGDHPIPFGKYIQTFENMAPHHKPSESQQWFDTFQTWAFGGKTVISFAYNGTKQIGGITDSLLFDENFPDQTVPTDRFYVQAEINRQSRNLGPALVSLLAKEVRLVPGFHRERQGFSNVVVENTLPSNVARWGNNIPSFGADESQWMTNVAVANLGTTNNSLTGDVIVSYFMPLVESDDGAAFEHEWYFMITNALSPDNTTPADCAQLITLNFDFRDSGIDSLERLNRLTGQIELIPLIHDGGSLYHYAFTLAGGVGDLFKFNTGAVFVGIEAVPEPSVLLLSPLVFLLKRRCRTMSNS